MFRQQHTLTTKRVAVPTFELWPLAFGFNLISDNTNPDRQATKRLLLRFRRSSKTDELLLGIVALLTILTGVETESGVPWKSLSVHSGEYRALSVDVIVNLNG